MPMENLLKEISRHHFPNPPASPEQIEAFERHHGWRLDPALRAFYLHCNGATLFQRPNSPCRFRALSQIRRARVDMRNSDTDEWGPASWYVIADLPDSDRIIIDVSTPINGLYPTIDGFHEAMLGPEECQRITASFSQFLEQMLRHQGRAFWLAPPAD
ncbi:MAG: SMI1/KNR4 family protein [Myxococcaceae bacterium]|nr:SMI1/KNR4 family protein [Myxococcaceae bacterium]